jgi:inner membrane transporter RhtA
VSALDNAAARATGAAPPWTLAVAAMLSIQLGSALSAGYLIPELGSGGTAWLRLSLGALILIAIARPPLRDIRRSDVLPLLGLGVATGLMTVFFLAAIARIPLGTAVAIEFLGPLAVAALRRPSARALAWPVLALVGVIAMTEPWRDSVDPVGVLYASFAGLGWGIYILLTQKVGDRYSGIRALSITIPVAALTAAVIGLPQAWGSLRAEHVLWGIGLALLVPVVPFALEMVALRRMTTTAFGTLMAVEPAIGLAIGLIVLAQVPEALHIVGIVLVVAAGTGAQRGGRRTAPHLDTISPT